MFTLKEVLRLDYDSLPGQSMNKAKNKTRFFLAKPRMLCRYTSNCSMLDEFIARASENSCLLLTQGKILFKGHRRKKHANAVNNT